MDRIALSALGMLSPESAHHAALFALAHGLVGARAEPDDCLLGTKIWGLDFSNPIGLAAGFDKDARVIDAMLGLGFGFVEAGTVTPQPQPGNPKPRLFRLDGDARSSPGNENLGPRFFQPHRPCGRLRQGRASH